MLRGNYSIILLSIFTLTNIRMKFLPKKVCYRVLVLFALLPATLNAQKAAFNGQVAGWGTINSHPDEQAGARFIPKLTLNLPAGKKFRIDGEFSADFLAQASSIKDSTGSHDISAALYRFWLRFSGERFEVRAGLQKINFGSALMLRPLMWFDRVDPRDPLRLTKGVWGIQGKYFFRNNASIWLWALDWNKGTKGWENIPSKWTRPEIGGRIQVPVPKGEMALSYHNRVARFPDDWQPPFTGDRNFSEQRIGYDIKVDLGVGLWAETSISHFEQTRFSPFVRIATLGANYTVGVLKGLNLTAEQMFYSNSEKLLSKGENITFTGFSASVPLSIITTLNTIFFYDWKNRDLYKFVNLSATFDKLSLNLIGFWNPDRLNLFNYSKGPNLFAGAGGQVMIVYNF